MEFLQEYFQGMPTFIVVAHLVIAMVVVGKFLDFLFGFLDWLIKGDVAVRGIPSDDPDAKWERPPIRTKGICQSTRSRDWHYNPNDLAQCRKVRENIRKAAGKPPRTN